MEGQFLGQGANQQSHDAEAKRRGYQQSGALTGATPARASDEAFNNIGIRLQIFSELVSRVEQAAGRIGGNLKQDGRAESAGNTPPQPDTLTWRLQATQKALEIIEGRLVNALNAIEAVV